MVFLTRLGPANGERSGADQGEMEVGGWGDGWERGNKKQVRPSQQFMFKLIDASYRLFLVPYL